MSAGSEFDPGWRPKTYWSSLPSDDDLVARIRGARRREALREALATGDLASLDPKILREALTDNERRALLRAHPHLALGEYLPDLEDADAPGGEVEIARLYIASGIGNTISIRASSVGSETSLRAVDEFADRLSLTPDRIEQPLSNAELLDAVKTLRWEGPLAHGEVYWTRELEAEVDLEAAAEFISGESEIYPAFATLVAEDNQDWLRSQYGESGEEEDDEE